MGLLNRLTTLWKWPSGGNGRRQYVDILTALKEDYRDLQRLAQQVKAHAELAPYPAVGNRLRQIAAEKEANAGRLREKIYGFGAMVDEDSDFTPFQGKNHWDRMARDLQDQRNLEDHLNDDLIFRAHGSTDISELLADIAATETVHRNAFQDLLVKADPQAFQS